jgi:hypothetical protein
MGMPISIESPQHSLEDFKSFLEALEELGLGEHYAMIGGMSVEVWRRRYLPNLPEIKSKDIDAIAQEDVALKIKEYFLKRNPELANFKKFYYEKAFTDGPVPLMGYTLEEAHGRVIEGVNTTMRRISLPQEDPEGKDALECEFLNRAGGLYDEKKQVAYGSRQRVPVLGGMTVSVMSPLDIFVSKLYVCVRAIEGDIYRHDEEHMKVLSQVIRPFLRDETARCKADPSRATPIVACDRLRECLGDWNVKLPPFVRSCQRELYQACGECTLALCANFC